MNPDPNNHCLHHPTIKKFLEETSLDPLAAVNEFGRISAARANTRYKLSLQLLFRGVP